MSPSWTNTQIDIQLIIVLQAFGMSCPGERLKGGEKRNYEWVNREAKATIEGSFIKAHLTMSKGARFLIWTRKASDGATRELNSFSYGP